MRTTLKRGIGRGAAVNGNGRASLPPDALSPIRLYRQPEPPRRSGWRLAGRILLWGAVVVAMLALALVGGIYLWLHESVAAIQARSTDVKSGQRALNAPLPNKAAIALVLGYDRRAGDGGGGSRSDTLMLLRADPGTKTISMLSLPRDLSVTVHCPGKTPFSGKINAAYSLCGSRGSLETVKALTGLPINYLVTVNFRGFKKVVNTLGGVWVDVDRRYYNDQGGPTGYAKINLRPGYQLLTGGSALDFVRYRHTDSDLFRVARQQLFVQAMKEQFARAFSYTKVPKLVGAITHNVEVGVGGGKEVSVGTILKYANLAYGLPSGHFFQARLNDVSASSYSSDLKADPANVEKAVREFANPDVEAPTVATAAALGRKLKPKVLKPVETTIQILNGNGVPGSAGNAKYQLGQRGYKILEPPSGATGNAPTWTYFHTKVYYNARDGRAKPAAKSVATLFGAADVAALPRGALRRLSNGALLTVVLGQTYHNSLAPASTAPVVKRQPPLVRYDPAETRELVRAKQKQVDFPLAVPTVLERGSVPDSELPVHAYRITKDHKAVRLVFRAGSGQFWGIQQTDWADAPVLDDKNFRHVLKGREYDFYYHGPKLHMIVLRENGTTYWVVNTLLDGLSNETMIAIAKGLQPLDGATKKAGSGNA